MVVCEPTRRHFDCRNVLSKPVSVRPPLVVDSCRVEVDFEFYNHTAAKEIQNRSHNRTPSISSITLLLKMAGLDYRKSGGNRA